MNDAIPLSVELFVATGCNHCPIVMTELSEQLKKGSIASLTIHNIAVDNARAEELNIRSVPWFSLTNHHSFMIFSGNHSPKEIQEELKNAQAADGMKLYIEDCLSKGELMTVYQAIQIRPDILSNVIAMLADEETSMDIRIGLDALIEQFSKTETLNKHADDLKKIALINIPRLQIDALHYIALTGNIENKLFLQEQTKNTNPQIKEAALEAIETLNDLTD
jgi:predicted metal-binding protein